MALRAEQLDDWCTDFLRRQPDAVVLHLGCGLDGRAFRLAVPPSVSWFDVDQPGVIGLRRRLYDDTDRCRMIGSSVTDAQWLKQVPTGRPTLVVAEGLLMYLREDDVRQLLAHLTDRFDGGEMFFDTLSEPAPLLSRLFTRGIVKWGIRDAHDLQRWNPRLRLLERLPALAGYQKIPSTVLRLMYEMTWSTPGRNYDVLNRFEYWVVTSRKPGAAGCRPRVRRWRAGNRCPPTDGQSRVCPPRRRLCAAGWSGSESPDSPAAPRLRARR